MARPTEEAERYFIQAQNATTRGILNAKNDPTAVDTFAALSNLAQGLANLAVGVRATYMLLEEVNRKLGPSTPRIPVSFEDAPSTWRAR
jgi:hypothetical protein